MSATPKGARRRTAAPPSRPTRRGAGALTRVTSGRLSVLRGGRGTPMVLLHGIPGSAHTWESVAESLTGSHDVIAPDLLGFGESAWPGDDYYMETQARALRETLTLLGVSECYLAAHDFGGPVALTMLRLFPELRVRGLLLAATNVFTDTYVPPPLRLARVPILGTAFFHFMAGNRPAFRMMHLQACVARQTLTWERFARHLTDGGIDLTRRIFQKSLADLKGNYQAIQDMLPHISVPTVVVWGDKDPFFAVSVGERTARAIPGARLVVYEETGHFVPEEQPERLAAEIARSFV